MHTCTTSIALSYKRILHTEAAHTNYLAGSSNIYTSKTPVPDFGAPSAYLSIGEKLYYNSGLSLNESIDLTSSGL